MRNFEAADKIFDRAIAADATIGCRTRIEMRPWQSHGRAMLAFAENQLSFGAVRIRSEMGLLRQRGCGSDAATEVS